MGGGYLGSYVEVLGGTEWSRWRLLFDLDL